MISIQNFKELLETCGISYYEYSFNTKDDVEYFLTKQIPKKLERLIGLMNLQDRLCSTKLENIDLILSNINFKEKSLNLETIYEEVQSPPPPSPPPRVHVPIEQPTIFQEYEPYEPLEPVIVGGISNNIISNNNYFQMALDEINKQCGVKSNKTDLFESYIIEPPFGSPKF